MVNKDQWVAMFREAGLDDAMMEKWHRVFERTAPESHQEFLELLGISADEIRKIREKFA